MTTFDVSRSTVRMPGRWPEGVRVRGELRAGWAEVLTPAALTFVADLQRRFGARRLELLAAREARQARLDAGELPDVLKETSAVRKADWTVAPLPPDLLDRRVEITGPVDRKMIINALNSGASTYMADFEDASAPTWANMVEGQVNLKDRWAGKLGFTDAASGPTSSPRRRRSARASGRSRRCPRRSSAGASRSPARWTRR